MTCNKGYSVITLDEFLSIIRVDLDLFVSDWLNRAETEPDTFPLEQDDFNEWLEHFIIFIAERQAEESPLRGEYYNEFFNND